MPWENCSVGLTDSNCLRTPISIGLLTNHCVVPRRRLSGRRQLECGMLMAEQFQNSALFPPHSEDLCVLDLVMLRTYVPDREFESIRKLPRKPNFARYLRDARTKRGLSVAESR